MRKGRFSEEQMVGILREADKDPVAQVAKRHGVSEQTISGWRQRFSGMNADDVTLNGLLGDRADCKGPMLRDHAGRGYLQRAVAQDELLQRADSLTVS